MMRTNKLFSILAIIIMVAISTVAYGQNEKNRVALKGSAVMVSDNATDWGLEVGGKLAVAKNYTHFKTSNGKFFAVEAKDGKMGTRHFKNVTLKEQK